MTDKIDISYLAYNRVKFNIHIGKNFVWEGECSLDLFEKCTNSWCFKCGEPCVSDWKRKGELVYQKCENCNNLIYYWREEDEQRRVC